MKLIEKDGLRILIPQDGFLLKLKNEEIYSDVVYLGVKASIDDWEEVEQYGDVEQDSNIDESIVQ